MFSRLFATLLSVLFLGTAAASTASEKEKSYVTFPGLPTCTTGVVLDGDPATGPNIVQAKASAGCVIPWHWHTPTENVMMVKGVAAMEMKDGKPVTLRAGDYGKVPSRHLHQFRCKTSCSFFIYSDGAFDIHYVDAAGKEISPEEALKPHKESTVLRNHSGKPTK